MNNNVRAGFSLKKQLLTKASFTEKSHNNADKVEKKMFFNFFYLFKKEIKKFEPLSYIELLHRNQLDVFYF